MNEEMIMIMKWMNENEIIIIIMNMKIIEDNQSIIMTMKWKIIENENNEKRNENNGEIMKVWKIMKRIINNNEIMKNNNEKYWNNVDKSEK